MPSEKFKISKASRSIRHAAQNFFGTFSASPNASHAKSVSYPIVGGNITASIQEDPETHLDRRCAHNALERQRRETLNSKFQELAHALPALQTVRRPSKTMIVAKSLDYVTKSIQREKNYVNQIRDLRKQNELLRKQAKASKVIHSTSNIKKKKVVSSSSTSSRATPMTPPLSTSGSSCTMQRSATITTVQSHGSPELTYELSSPPLTPQTPSKPHHASPITRFSHQQQHQQQQQQQQQQPLIDATWTDSSPMLVPCQHHANDMMTATWTAQQPRPISVSPDLIQATTAPEFYTSPPMHYNANRQINALQYPTTTATINTLVNDPAAAYLTYSDSMLFAPYQWQDNPPLYHNHAKAGDSLYLV
ncbi:hypothetical protein BCR42DRAFT_417500 [Absidia repens]|uniref:BHLH domain-containing protein n=1 Tax=Absidia repens TaxID=90262 RepID=A0A1X2IDY2_9FUNG|nr:hypothetical protein BCR42DRAFT_417500 [Absidia repens]